MSATFAELANTKVGDVTRPPALPEGHYQAVFCGKAKEHKAKTQNIALRFPFKLTAAEDDVDSEALEAAGGIPDKEYTIDFWMSPDARWRFTEFAKSMGVNEDLNLIEAAEELAGGGQPFIIACTQQTGEKDPEAIFNRFDNPVAA